MPCFAKWVFMLLVVFCLWESDVCQSQRVPVFSSTCIQQISRSTSRLLLVLLITHGQSTAVVSKYPQIHSVAGAGRLHHREDTWLVIEVPASVELSWDTSTCDTDSEGRSSQSGMLARITASFWQVGKVRVRFLGSSLDSLDWPVWSSGKDSPSLSSFRTR